MWKLWWCRTQKKSLILLIVSSNVNHWPLQFRLRDWTIINLRLIYLKYVCESFDTKQTAWLKRTEFWTTTVLMWLNHTMLFFSRKTRAAYNIDALIYTAQSCENSPAQPAAYTHIHCKRTLIAILLHFQYWCQYIESLDSRTYTHFWCCFGCHTKWYVAGSSSFTASVNESKWRRKYNIIILYLEPCD